MSKSSDCIVGPSDYNGTSGPKAGERNAPTTNYPGSSKIEPKASGIIEGPAEGGYKGHGSRGKK